MKKLYILAIMAGVVLSPMMVYAESMEPMQGEAVEVVEVGNKLCPVSGEKIGGMGEAYQVDYHGKKYSLCCSMCVKDFNNNAPKFAKVADDEVAASATVKN